MWKQGLLEVDRMLELVEEEVEQICEAQHRSTVGGSIWNLLRIGLRNLKVKSVSGLGGGDAKSTSSISLKPRLAEAVIRWSRQGMFDLPFKPTKF